LVINNGVSGQWHLSDGSRVVVVDGGHLRVAVGYGYVVAVV
jgi:hypothetical protein